MKIKLHPIYDSPIHWIQNFKPQSRVTPDTHGGHLEIKYKPMAVKYSK